ncbi:MAG: hypothetical protein KGZ83_14865 [Sulfuricella sp.]|nr:hypothetical protein [Sulfuricella sp.]
MAVLDETRIVIADTYNHKLAARTLTTQAGSGRPGSETDLKEPGGLAICGDKVLIAGTNDNRIVQYDLNTRKLTDWPITE